MTADESQSVINPNKITVEKTADTPTLSLVSLHILLSVCVFDISLVCGKAAFIYGWPESLRL